MDFDTEKFILEIKDRPAIWDSKCADHPDRNKRLKCWEEMINIYAKEDDTPEEKKELGKVLMKKWRNIKDNFVKASKNLKNMKSGSGAKQKSPYTYYNILLFLKDSTMVKYETESDNDLSQNHDGPYKTSRNVANQKRRKKSNNEDVIGQQLVSVLKKNLEYKKRNGK
ncbi:unnamed protein product [Pieris macdunnoughi]|uniref:MADF domain-containing protein n=1 Tax=Pieris macdunnoughi TaxID=345717 RepID=A0A821WZV5_9NEOP|nr:unnamed protein product [Pieris macdunnoughi]